MILCIIFLTRALNNINTIDTCKLIRVLLGFADDQVTALHRHSIF